ncbi:hypothetical protein ACI6Q2_00605 [Chitinophagaceae bacterium LWZ2-11]
MEGRSDFESAALQEPKNAKENKRKTTLLIITLVSFLLFLNNCITEKSLDQRFLLTSCKTDFVVNKNEFILNISIGSINKKLSMHRFYLNKVEQNKTGGFFLNGAAVIIKTNNLK